MPRFRARTTETSLRAIQSWFVASLIAFASCKGDEQPMDCATIIPQAVERIMADHSTDPRVAGVLDRTKQEFIAVCTQDRWSESVGACVADATDRAQMDRCRGRLTSDQLRQVDEVNQRLRAAIAGE